METLFQGSGIALITPFRNGEIDWDAYLDLIEFQLINGTSALIVCGTTGEPATMSAKERVELVKFTVEHVAGRVPVIAGSGSNSTSATIEESLTMQALGVDGLLVVTPYYNKATQEGLLAHYTAVADAVNVPVIAYNIPSRTGGVNIEPTTMLKLSAHPNIIGLKEASVDLQHIMEMFRLCRGKIAIYSGNDDQVFTLLALGGNGVISVAAHIIPSEMHNMVRSYLEGDVLQSLEIQEKYSTLIKALFTEVNPIPVKAALSILGKIDNELRLPLTPLSRIPQENLVNEMKKSGLVSS